MNENVELVFKDESEQKDCRYYMYEPSLLVDVDEECSDLTNLLPELKRLYYTDPLSAFITVAKDSHSLEQFTMILMDSMGLIKTESQKHLDELRKDPKFLVLSSYIEMIATAFPPEEKVIKTLKTMIDASEIKENWLNAVDLMFADLEHEASETNRAVYQHHKFCQFPLEEKQEAIAVLTKAFEQYYPDKVSEEFNYLDVMPLLVYLPCCQNNAMQTLKRNCIIHCFKTGLLDRKVFLRVNGGSSDIAPSLIGEEDYIEKGVTVVTPAFQKLIETISKTKAEKEHCELNTQWEGKRRHESK